MFCNKCGNRAVILVGRVGQYCAGHFVLAMANIADMAENDPTGEEIQLSVRVNPKEANKA